MRAVSGRSISRTEALVGGDTVRMWEGNNCLEMWRFQETKRQEAGRWAIETGASGDRLRR